MKSNALLFLIIIWTGTLLGCEGKIIPNESEVIVDLPNSADISASSIWLEDHINPRREENSNWELSLDESSELLNIFGHPKRLLTDDVRKWEISGQLAFETADGLWQIPFFLCGKSFYYRIDKPYGPPRYYESHFTVEEFNEKLRSMFE